MSWTFQVQFLKNDPQPALTLRVATHNLYQNICIFESLLEKTKSALESRNFSFASSVGGAVGSICHDLWMNPADVVKQRLQLQGSPYISQSYSSIVRSIYQTEGLFAFYVSFPTQILMNGMSFHLN